MKKQYTHAWIRLKLLSRTLFTPTLVNPKTGDTYEYRRTVSCTQSQSRHKIRTVGLQGMIDYTKHHMNQS